MAIIVSVSARAADPYQANCQIRHVWQNPVTGAPKTIHSYSLPGKFVLDDDHYQMMVVPYAELSELGLLFAFRHTLSGPIGAPTETTPAWGAIYRKAGEVYHQESGLDVGDLDLGVHVSGSVLISERSTSHGMVNSVHFNCVTIAAK